LTLVAVTLVSLMVQVYSIAYMHDDKRFKRYFAFVSFFTAAMLGWSPRATCCDLRLLELMGLSSYLLIGFWFEREGPCEAQKKAFMTTKLGDSGLYLALLFIFAKVGSFQLSQLQQFFDKGYMPATPRPSSASASCWARRQVAQAPSSSGCPTRWKARPRAPRSSRRDHGGRGHPPGLQDLLRLPGRPAAMERRAGWTGDRVPAASMALVSYDIKRVLAFSTISQLGFMMCALAWAASLGPVPPHHARFFKPCSSSGPARSSTRAHNDMRQMGPLQEDAADLRDHAHRHPRHRGVPAVGYYSKDMILANVWNHDHLMFWILLFTALMTAFYMFRLFFLTFWATTATTRSSPRHESPASSRPAHRPGRPLRFAGAGSTTTA